MLTVLDGPVLAGVEGQVAGPGQADGQAGDAVGDLLVRPRAAGGAAVAADAQDLGGVRPVDAVRGGGADAAPLAAAVPVAFFGLLAGSAARLAWVAAAARGGGRGQHGVSAGCGIARSGLGRPRG
jgi:hypothetical protein